MKKVILALIIAFGLAVVGVTAQVYLSPTQAEGPRPQNPDPP